MGKCIKGQVVGPTAKVDGLHNRRSRRYPATTRKYDRPITIYLVASDITYSRLQMAISRSRRKDTVRHSTIYQRLKQLWEGSQSLARFTGLPAPLLIGCLCLITIWLGFRANEWLKNANRESVAQTAPARWTENMASRQDCEAYLARNESESQIALPGYAVALASELLPPPWTPRRASHSRYIYRGTKVRRQVWEGSCMHGCQSLGPVPRESVVHLQINSCFRTQA